MRRYAGLAGWLVAAVVLVMGAGQSETHRVKKIVIEDEQGRLRMMLSTTRTGQPFIAMSDEHGDCRFSLALDAATGRPRFLTQEKGEAPRDLLR